VDTESHKRKFNKLNYFPSQDPVEDQLRKSLDELLTSNLRLLCLLHFNTNLEGSLIKELYPDLRNDDWTYSVAHQRISNRTKTGSRRLYRRSR